MSSSWGRDDPLDGANIYLWKQNIEEITCSTPLSCKMVCPGVYKPGPNDSPGRCYSYDVLKSICIEIRPSVDVANAEQIWEYRGGCYENDSPTLFERAIPGATYDFSNIPIEVRGDSDPYTALSKDNSDE